MASALAGEYIEAVSGDIPGTGSPPGSVPGTFPSAVTLVIDAGTNRVVGGHFDQTSPISLDGDDIAFEVPQDVTVDIVGTYSNHQMVCYGQESERGVQDIHYWLVSYNEDGSLDSSQFIRVFVGNGSPFWWPVLDPVPITTISSGTYVLHSEIGGYACNGLDTGRISYDLELTAQGPTEANESVQVPTPLWALGVLVCLIGYGGWSTLRRVN